MAGCAINTVITLATVYGRKRKYRSVFYAHADVHQCSKWQSKRSDNVFTPELFPNSKTEGVLEYPED